MSEKTANEKMTGREWFLAIMGAMAFTGHCGVCYMVHSYYSLFQEAAGYTDAQLGLIMSMVGIVAAISYFIGGFLADMFRPKILLMFSFVSVFVLSLSLLTFPSFNVFFIIFCLIAVLTLAPFWCPLSKTIAQIAGPKTGKVMGLFFGLVGVFMIGGGVVASALVAAFDAKTGLISLVIFYCAMMVACFIAWPFIDRSKKGDAVEKTNSINLSVIKKLVTNPDMWLAWLIITCINQAYFGFTEATPLLTEKFGVSVATMTLLGTVRTYGVRSFMGPLGGNLANKFGTVKAMNLMFGLFGIGLAMLIFLPWNPSMQILGIAGMLIMAIGFAGHQPMETTILTDMKTPDYILGTSLGLLSSIMSLPDSFTYAIAGNLIAKFGDTGYRIVFGACFFWIALGVVCGVIMTRRMKNGKNKVAEL